MLLLRQCGGFCRLIHLARTIPPSLAGDALSLFDDEMRQCFAECTAVDTPDFTWQQAQLSLSRGGLGLHHVSYHSPAAYLASAVSSGLSCEQLPAASQQLPAAPQQLSSPPHQEPLAPHDIPSTSSAGHQTSCSFRKRCPVSECPERIAPSMLRSHMSLHAQGLFPGGVPQTWLFEQDLFICPHCSQLVANSRVASHSRQCKVPPPISSAQNDDTQSASAFVPDLPTFADVCQLKPNITAYFCWGNSQKANRKCLCSLVKDKVSSCFEPHQFGVACSHGTEKVVHGLRKCIEEHWDDEDFIVLKVDMRNAFNLISRQALLSECSTFFPELLPWARWCYGSHPYLWHPLGHLTSEAGVQQGDPLGPLFFALVLHKVIDAIDADDDCLHLILQAWYLDDRVLAGPRQAVLRALSIIEDLGPPLGVASPSAYLEAAWCQSQLSLRFGVFGLRSLSHHSSAAFIASFCSSGFATADNHHLIHAVNTFNSLVSTSDAISPESAIESPPSQRSLSHKLDSLTHSRLYDSASPANKARLLSASASLATSWVSVLPSGELGLHFDPREFRTAISWWLGLETTKASCCLLCPELALDPLGHHALSCRRGGDVVLQHNQLRDVFVDICHKANLGVRIEAGTAALLAEQRKHQANDPKCDTLGWKCIPLAVESYGNWGFEAKQAFSHLASRLSFGIGHQKSKLLYGRLNVTLKCPLLISNMQFESYGFAGRDSSSRISEVANLFDAQLDPGALDNASAFPLAWPARCTTVKLKGCIDKLQRVNRELLSLSLSIQTRER
ncbi:hypothetical protein EMCRGX_G002723 [Ephydatia muelleri]